MSRYIDYLALAGEVRRNLAQSVYRTNDLMSILAEDILADLGVRQALRKMPKSARL